MVDPRHKLRCAALATAIVASASASQAQENKVNLFKVVTIKDADRGRDQKRQVDNPEDLPLPS
jgi:hypothetical protein